MTLARINARRTKRRPATFFEQIMAFIILLNLILVLFDLSYIPLRDTYLRFAPEQTVWYGERFKGIEPERTTVGYLRLVDSLERELAKEEMDGDRIDSLLSQLQEESAVIIDEDPFAGVGKSGKLERIKNAIRDHRPNDSAKAAFREFWRADNFTPVTAEAELAFFRAEIRPLIETNYYRGINERGNPVDLFWQIDIWFSLLFAAEFLLRTLVLSRRHPHTSWLDAMLWRIYDVPLFLPFWRWLRIIPATLRLNQARWIDLEPIRNRISRALVSQFAVELTEIVLLRVIDQAQQSIRKGDVSRWLLAATDRTRYVDINGVDEVQTIAKRLSDVVVYQVLPKVKPELDALLQHSVVGALHQAPAYQGLKFMPGFDTLSAQISRQVVAELSKTLVETLQNVFADQEGAELTSALIARFSEQLRLELQTADNLQDVGELVCDLLEEIKINYVEVISQEDIDQIQETRYRLYGATQRTFSG